MNTTKPYPRIEAIDLFCGAGGLTYGLQKSGINVLAGVDIDPHCQYPYEENNGSRYIDKSVDQIHGKTLKKLHSKSTIRVLAGCAPCQPFSTYSQGTRGSGDDQWKLLREFSRLVAESEPQIVTMENVPKLESHPVFQEFVGALTDLKYHVSYETVKCEEYGLPQTRKRLVLLASKLGKIELIPPSSKIRKKTVRFAIGAKSQFPALDAGKGNEEDPLHLAASLSDINIRRIEQSKPGGTWRDWDEDLVTNCHKSESGRTYTSVYGRMTWDAASPTITTQYYGFGNGRFGHPEQNRALSLREGAVLQSFPKNYKFVPQGQKVEFKKIGRMVGNAVPPLLGTLIGNSIKDHVARHS